LIRIDPPAGALVSGIGVAVAVAPVETLQPQYSLVERGAESAVLPFAEREGIGVIVYSPMGSGMLTGAMTRARSNASWPRSAVDR